MQDNKNILLAAIVSMVILVGWTWFYEKPRIEKKEAEIRAAAIANKKVAAAKLDMKQVVSKKEGSSAEVVKNDELQSFAISLKDRNEVILETKNERIFVENENIHGSISLRGARFDDLTLEKYFKEIDKKNEVILFSPSKSKERYFADFGFLSSDKTLDLPTPDTLWKSNSQKLTVNNPVILSWKNKQNIEFIITISLDDNFMFDVEQKIINRSGHDVAVAIYGRTNRVLNLVNKPNYILHEGPIGVFNDVLQEFSYKKMTEENSKNFASKNGGWLGITDKYWLSAIIPDKAIEYNSDFSYNLVNKNQIFNAEFSSPEFNIEKNGEAVFKHHLFAGAKRVTLLDEYAKKYDIKLFDRAVDFGWFYFLTKPFFLLINFLNKFLGNFGLAILAMTVLVKLALFPMANKSYAAIAKMKTLQPDIEEIRKKFKSDKMAMNREIMELYKKKKANPASGCLPMLIQIPIFFSLYKVIFVTLDMRHAPFYGWIKDLSAPDPTSVFNLFGLLPYEVHGILVLGIWPILMGLTMVLQQKLNPQPADATQAKVLKFMPYVLTFVLASFPAGLVIYWTWNNILSVLQQIYIGKKLEKVEAAR